MAELIMRKVLDRLGVVLLLKVRVIVVSAQQSGAVQFFLFIFRCKKSVDPSFRLLSATMPVRMSFY